MDTARINDRAAREALLWATDADICAVQREEDMAAEIAFIDQIIEDVDRELAAEDRTVTVRLTHDFTDQRRARRAARRAGRTALRSLPVRADVADLLDGEAA